MSDRKHLTKRRNIWFINYAVPSEYQEILGKKFIGVTTGTQDLRQARIISNRFMVDVDNTILMHLPTLQSITSSSRVLSNVLVRSTTHIPPALRSMATSPDKVLKYNPSIHFNTIKISLITARGDYLTVNSSKEAKYTYVKNEYSDTNIQAKYYNASATINLRVKT